jgi:ankyrin repeat protein
MAVVWKFINYYAWTPLCSAAHNGQVEVVQDLLKYGASMEGLNSDG